MRILLDSDRHWLAGLLEGEGSFLWHRAPRDKHGRPRISVQMADEDVVRRASEIMQCHFTGPYGPYRNSKLPTWFAHCSGEQAYSIMQELLPLMGSRRQGKIKEQMDKYENSLA